MSIDEALSPERLGELRPPWEEAMQNTRRSRMWYNEAVWTAAALMVDAAQESGEFRDSFLEERKIEEYNEDWDMTVEHDEWREVMKHECPEMYDDLMGIGLSAFQGGSAEQVARRYLRES